jgi:hypothetical protein
MSLSKKWTVLHPAAGQGPKLTKRFGVVLGSVALCGAGLLALPAAAGATSTTTGSWYSYPAQTSSTSTSTTTAASYRTAVRPPINADGSSNYPAKRGVIPVQFDLQSAPSTTTTTTTTYDPPVWQSLQADGSFSLAGLNLSPNLTFNDITKLSADYLFTTGDCQAGSLRWDIRVVHNGVGQNVEVYYGNPSNTPNPPGQTCSGAFSETGQNLISSPTAPVNRFEMLGGWAGGPQYTDYAAAQAATNGGTDQVTQVQLTLDSGFAGDQKANVSNVTVNDNTWVPKTTSTTTSTVTGAFANTCALPGAELRWAKNDNTATGAVNEADSIQPKDTGQFYRQVDCKYIYNLDVSSLSGTGTYTVWARIGGNNVTLPATFDLR